MDHRETARELFKAWPYFSPQRRAQVAAGCTERAETAEMLVIAVQQGVIAPAEISVSFQNQLIQSSAPATREAATKLWGKRHSDRAEIVAQYRKALTLKSNAGQGAKVFEEICANCHVLNGLGHSVGPDLA